MDPKKEKMILASLLFPLVATEIFLGLGFIFCESEEGKANALVLMFFLGVILVPMLVMSKELWDHWTRIDKD